MVVALDGTPLTLSSGGLRRYTEELINALRSEFPEDTYHVVSDQLAHPTNALDRRWWSIGLPRTLLRLECDLFHGGDFAVPYLPVRPAVMSLHDLSPWMNPEWHKSAARVRRRAPILIGLGLAAMLIVPTRAIRDQAIDYFRISPARVAIVPDAAARHLQRREPWPGRYFLFAGTVEPRKNVPALVSAWRKLREQHEVDLIVAGRRRPDGPVIGAESGLHVLDEVTDEQLASLYSGAVALVYPSSYEGFGLPVVEAMQCGCAVITSRDPALIEVAGGAALHVDSDRLAEAMEALLVDDEELQRRRDLSIRRAAEFSWERTARLTREVYVEALRIS